jgi:hypothetical protein
VVRVVQKEAVKGSQKWIQKLINNHPELVNSSIKKSLDLLRDEMVTWYSPLKSDDYAEYRDEAFLKLLDIKLELYPLKDFWPRGGPRWDGLGKSSSGKIFLVEAKSHITELILSMRATNEDSKRKIQSGLGDTKKRLESRVTLTGHRLSISMLTAWLTYICLGRMVLQRF